MFGLTVTGEDGRTFPLTVFTPDKITRDIVFLHSAADEAEDVWTLLADDKPVLCAVGGIEWNRDLSPWTSPAVFRASPDFSGGADRYLDTLAGHIVPRVVSAVAEHYEVPADFRLTLAGYSLAGLFAAYAPYRTGVFTRIASMSGSMWFDGFADFAASDAMTALPERAYFSLGDREKKARDPRMATVADRTAEVVDVYRGRGIATEYVSEAGGHFTDVPARIARGIAAVLEK